MFTLSPALKIMYPEAFIGILAMQKVLNPQHHPELDKQKTDLETALRLQFSGSDKAALKALPTLQAYRNFYKQFDKTYHVQLQLESIVFKGKSIPSVAALVEAMFMAELKNQLLTAGHDLAVVQPPIRAGVAEGGETYTGIGGKTQTLKAGDMMITDNAGVISSILYGPDQRTRLTPATTQALFTVYTPAGIKKQAVLNHLQDIQTYVQLIAPAQVSHLEVYGGNL